MTDFFPTRRPLWRGFPLYAEALARVRETLAFYASRPDFLPHSLELEDCARATAKAARSSGIPISALSADLRQLVADALPAAPEAAIVAVRAMARWAAQEYEEADAGYGGPSTGAP